MNILEEIIVSRRKDYESKTISETELSIRYRERTDFRSFRDALQNKIQFSFNTAAVIAEIKRGSPSKGLFAPELDPVICATEYEKGGAACLSVLTEPHYFSGSLDDLIAARRNCRLPVLRKDFIVSEYQVYETALYADCMLLIARCLDATQLKDLHDLAASLRIDVLVEVSDETDIRKIEPFHFPLIGINNRNLATMNVDTEIARNFVRYFTSDQIIVAASGISSRADIETTMQSGIRSFLIGESLSKSSDRIKTLRQFVIGKSE
ncbi:MAG: indole-3-glycerol phosphate synthase TrpC [Planctomycetaceae bacterium]|jgi:indole-3-glycerol phosphate synthase|nr:indole-3-glycerol phosphate synthase TrpC [Planctomycetaceae bacterium]